AGCGSKDEILRTALEARNFPLLSIGIVTAFMTAFYIFRAYFLTFSGDPRPHWVDPDEYHGADAPRFAIDVAHAPDPISAVAYEPNAYYEATHGPAGEHHHEAHTSEHGPA